jgi:hypothetical protein
MTTRGNLLVTFLPPSDYQIKAVNRFARTTAQPHSFHRRIPMFPTSTAMVQSVEEIRSSTRHLPCHGHRCDPTANSERADRKHIYSVRNFYDMYFIDDGLEPDVVVR